METNGRLAAEQYYDQTYTSGRLTSVGMDGWEGRKIKDGKAD